MLNKELSISDDLNFLVNEDDNISNNNTKEEQSISVDNDEDIFSSADEEIVDIKENTKKSNKKTSDLKKEDLVKKDNNVIMFDKSIFGLFMDVLQMLKFSCSDLYINEGYVSQFNSKMSMMYLIDLTPILGNTTLILNNLIFKHELLSMFKKQNSDVKLEIFDDSYIFSDLFSKIHFKKALEKYLQSIKLDKEKVKEDFNKSDIIHTIEWNKTILDRLLVYSKTLSSNSLKFVFMNDNIICKVQALDSESTTQIDLMTIEDCLDNSSLNGVSVSFPNGCFLDFMQAGIFNFKTSIFFRKIKGKDSIAIESSGSLPIPGLNKNIDVFIYGSSYLKKQ